MARKQHSDLDFQGIAKLLNLPDPTGAQDAATMAYVDAVVEGLAWKDSCRVSTQSNISLASPGATIDGITMASGDRVLVRNQTAGSENGIYVWTGAAVLMSRSNDCSTAAELEQAITAVEEGTDAGTVWRQTAVNFTLESGTVSWSAFASTVPDASTSVKGKIQLATQGEVDTGTDTLKAVVPSTLANSVWAKKKATANIGDGAATQYDVVHNFNTRLVEVAVFRNSSPWDDIGVDISRPDANTVRLNFASAPSSNQFTVVIIG